MKLPIIQTIVALALLCPFVSGQEIKLLASDGEAHDWFGCSVAVSGNTAIVGAKKENSIGTERGSAYLFDVTTGAELAKLLASDGAHWDWFGNSVAISGNTAIVGASEDDDNGTNSGSAYLFDISNPAAPVETKLLPNDGADGDYFGYSVAISGSTALVGASKDDSSNSNFDSGSAYIFDTSTGTQTFKLSPSGMAEAGDWFGHSVAIDGTIAIIGSPNDDDQGSNCGCAYLFDTTTGSQIFKLLPSDGAADDSFGWSVAISGNTAIVGARKDDDNGGDSGSAYLFDTTTGTQIAKLLVSDGEWNDHFGFSVAIHGDVAIVGALYGDDHGQDSGSAYLFGCTTGIQIAKLLPSDGASNDLFGCAVAINGDRAIVGAQWDTDNGSESGSAYLYSNGDCNINGVWDWQDIASGSSPDCNNNGVPDYCDITYFTSQDCNSDLVPDECQITGNDCNSDLIPDECQLAGNDCNSDQVPDDCDLVFNDCNFDLIPDDCQITGNDCNSDLIPDDCQLGGNDFNSNGIPDECDCVARWFCSTSPNSVGPGMSINYEGHLSVSVNTLTLTASGGPVNQPGLFYYGPGQVNDGNGIPFGNGLRCVSAAGVGVFRIQDPISGNAYAFIDSAGNTTKPFDMTYSSMGSGYGQIQPGGTWNFQYWYRDPTVGPPGQNFNLTDAMELTFCP